MASAYFILGALAGMGVPGFANFWAELMVFISSLKIYPAAGDTGRILPGGQRPVYAPGHSKNLLWAPH